MSAPRAGSVLMVCLGNICRSPSAAAVLDHRARLAGLSMRVDSAGTGNWHQGHPPDRRALAALAARAMAGPAQRHRARQIVAQDFFDFAWIFAMDRQNLADLRALCPSGGTAPRLLLSCWPDAPTAEIPDPYYGGPEGFALMLDLIEGAVDNFVQFRLAARAGT